MFASQLHHNRYRTEKELPFVCHPCRIYTISIQFSNFCSEAFLSGAGPCDVAMHDHEMLCKHRRVPCEPFREQSLTPRISYKSVSFAGEVHLGEQPDKYGASIGLTLHSLSDSAGDNHVLVKNIADDSPAHTAGLRGANSLTPFGFLETRILIFFCKFCPCKLRMLMMCA
jgi:hypothetical protein